MNATLKRRLLGLVFYVVVIGLLATSVLIFMGTFKSTTDVTLEASSVGNALTQHSDVKARGVVVGSVDKVNVHSDGTVAVTLALDPKLADQLPANSTARILPKTLFGERYVALQIPDDPEGNLGKGGTIHIDAKGNAPEVEDLFDALLPILQAVPPEDLNATLTSINSALAGRGPQLKKAIEQLNDIFGALNKNMPALQGTLEGLASFSQTYSQALPDVIDALDNFRVTNRTIVDRQGDLRNTIATLGVASVDATKFLKTNKKDVVNLFVDSETLLVQLARQSPVFGCTFKNFAEIVPKVGPIVGKGTENPGVHVNVQFVNPRGRYLPNQDEPRMWWLDPPARCYDKATNGRPFGQYPGGSVPDGSYQPPSRNPGPATIKDLPQPQFSAQPQGAGMTDSEYVTKMKMIYGADSGQYPAQVPTWVTYIGGGAVKGAEVTIK
ncbi:MCE family protein [Gordonia sp. (in: high G+C Gram-positive bacteria)]|uniref:MCE family protein n=1 Tax=unclassified Gordonia (in: high G+C Gram-positive bacteria) TaxID=2657482 RepID=UPI00260E1E80|nr:MCE family protein [Gordonia sp. (in: high G+C Gram-positive bacteria)]